MSGLTPEKSLIFRITHINNLPYILEHGIHCRSGDIHDPNFTNIGLPDLIERRAVTPIPIAPGGTLSDYVPFYFTPYSIMMLNIKTGYNGLIQRENSEIVIMVSSLHRLIETGTRLVFTNGHAKLAETDFFDSLDDLHRIDWPLLQSRNFKRDENDPGKQGRYQAEALAHRHVPIDAFLGIVCYNDAARDRVQRHAHESGCQCDIKAIPSWFFK